MNNPVSRLDMIRALVAYARSNIMATSEEGEELLRLVLNHYYDDLSYNHLEIEYRILASNF